jgi:gliding motility-associated-like protein
MKYLRSYFLSTLFLSTFLLSSVWGRAQHGASTWYLGNGYGLKFDKGSPTIVKAGPSNTAVNYTYSNAAGQVILYANSNGIFNKSGLLVENGQWGLRNLGFDMYIIPKPGSSSLFYIFYTFKIENDEEWHTWVDYQAVGYAIVDIAANNGAGKVLEKDKVIYQGTHGYFTVSGNCGDNTYWLVGEADTNRELYTDQFFAFKITEHGVASEPVRSEPASIGNANGLKFSPTGTKLVFSYRGNGHYEGLGLANFNPVTGEVSKSIRIEEANWKATFSASGNKLYLNSYSQDINHIWQLDISSDNEQEILASKTLVYSGPLRLTESQLATNGKIYLSQTNYTQTLSVINYPERAGAACELTQNAIVLPQVFFGLLPVFASNFLYSITQSLDAGPDREVRQGQDVALGGAYDSNLSYFWEPAIYLSDPTSPNPIFRYNGPSTGKQELTYRLYVREGTCLQSDEVNITVLPLYEEISSEHIPNIFTPNGDNINDYFSIPLLELYPENELVVVNRFGNEVYRKKGYQGNWNGGNVAAGIYYYQLHIEALDRYIKGWVEIVR